MWSIRLSFTWMMLILMTVPVRLQLETTQPPIEVVTPRTVSTSTIAQDDNTTQELDVKTTLLTPMEQMDVEMEAASNLTEERSEEKDLREIDESISRRGTAINQHSQFTFSTRQSVILGRQHRIFVIQILIAIRIKFVIKVHLPQLLPLGFGARFQCPTECPCNINDPYRTANGHCNNLKHTHWGERSIPMRRWLYPDYDDGVASPRQLAFLGGFLPSARLVSTTVHIASADSDQHEKFTHMLMQWGQFLDHDITSTPTQQIPQGPYTTSVGCCQRFFPSGGVSQAQLNFRPQCFPIQIPVGDHNFPGPCMNFVRSVQVANARCHAAPVEQLNQITAYIDASQVYGSSHEEQNDLRTFIDGKLKELDNHLPPDDIVPDSCPIESPTDYCFLAGDQRVNENPTLQSMHTIFMRGHNKLAMELQRLNCHWDDERLFQETRKIVGAVMQVITYKEYLPIILGPGKMAEFGLNVGSGSGYANVYSTTTDASIRNAFAAAAYRFGHSMIRSLLGSFKPDYSSLGTDVLHEVFGRTHPILSIANRQVGHYCRGLVTDCAQNVDCKLSSEVTDHLFESSPGDGFDLAALNIQRGRDHGLPSYTAWRKFCGLKAVSKFDELVLSTHTAENAKKLEKVYNHVNDIDLFSGGLTESPVSGGLVGPTFACLLGRQFQALKKGDRFYFEEDNDNVKFTPDQLEELRKLSLSHVICANTDTVTIQKNAFNKGDPRVKCGDLESFNLTAWKEIIGSWSDWSEWGRCKDGLETRTRTCKPCNCGCEGANSESRACHYDPCGWSPWSYWSECKKDWKFRTRDCRCPGCSTEVDHCY